MGGWLPPYGIEYVIDDASSFMIVLISLMGVFATIFAYQSLKKEINKKSHQKFMECGCLHWVVCLDWLLLEMLLIFCFFKISSLSSVTLVALGSKKTREP